MVDKPTYSPLYKLKDGSVLQIFAAFNGQQFVGCFLVDHNNFPSATSFLKWFEDIGLPGPLNGAEWTSVRTATLDEAEDFIGSLQKEVLGE